MSERHWLRLPLVSASAEYLVMGHLMRRNILTYKAPPNNEGVVSHKEKALRRARKEMQPHER